MAAKPSEDSKPIRAQRRATRQISEAPGQLLLGGPSRCNGIAVAAGCAGSGDGSRQSPFALWTCEARDLVGDDARLRSSPLTADADSRFARSAGDVGTPKINGQQEPGRRDPDACSRPKSARAVPCRRLLDCRGGRRALPSAFDPIGPSGALVQTRVSSGADRAVGAAVAACAFARSTRCGVAADRSAAVQIGRVA